MVDARGMRPRRPYAVVVHGCQKSHPCVTILAITYRFRDLNMLFPSFQASGLKCRTHALSAAISALLFIGLSSNVAYAVQVPANLGNSLDKLVASNIAVKAKPANALYHDAQGRGFSTEQAQTMAALAIVDVNNPNTYLVRVNLDGSKAMTALVANLQSTIPSLNVLAKDEKYRKVGVLNAFVSIDDVPALANVAGVRSVILELKPFLRTKHLPAAASTESAPQPSGGATNGEAIVRLGTVYDQGVTQHRIDQINQYYNPLAPVDYEGQGMSIGFLSDSYNNKSTAPTGVTNFNLPGAAGNPVNTTPVVVLQDLTSGGTDEGQAMVQIGYKMAPKAKLAFASADYGEVGFANNIRALAGIPTFTYPGQTFAADTICDDVGYFDEPFFQDGIIAQGVNDAAAHGVSYYSSAGNDVDINSYESDLRWVANGTGLTAAAGNTALAGTNIDLTSVPTISTLAAFTTLIR
ncbi:hypothetical protein ELE36_10960 [Pseudolysobacter antarcticus]|uniref:Peptidase S8/S53 domain-containing protein n=1 Tax=Pseudolysobacter antarcticus TaxID=2511995 RepID=A0A411HJX1_9GAMM|nr:hypothetical protein [Pseudolysobacter antarcticus]QBB70832.1 hypothetical protein ELE36_10960 [Pseudolysobacter antarcticus]